MKISGNSLLICLVLSAELNNAAYAYIDPGTGSMLFSILLGAITTLIFICNNLFLKLKLKLSVKGSNAKLKNEKIVIYSEGKQYYCVFKPILDEFEKRKIPVTFFTSAEDDQFFKDKYEYIKGEYIGKGNIAYFKLAMLNCDVCLMTTPQLDVLQLKRSKFVKHYAHIFHAITCSINYRLFSLDYYDSVLCDGDFQIPIIRELEQKRSLPPKELVVVGCTYMDYYRNQINDLPPRKNDKYTVLIAPSWGPYGLFSKYGDTIIEQLKNKEYNIIIRPHPQSMIVEKDRINKMAEKYSACSNISWNFDSDNLQVLSISDIMISDFSSVMFDYAFLFNRPFLYLKTIENGEIYDTSDLDEEPYRNKIMNLIGHEITENEIEKITDIIEQYRNNPQYDTQIDEIKHVCWMNEGKAAENVVNFLVAKQKEISTK